jgi:predicted dehydrogenase
MPPSDTLDVWRNPLTDVRIRVEGWYVQEPITDQFVQRPRDATMVWNYLRRVGPVAVARKIRSRLAESRRNVKIAGIGRGWIVDRAAGDDALRPGTAVVFFAPNHAPDWTHVVIDAQLACAATPLPLPTIPSAMLPAPLGAIAGWSPYSGVTIDAGMVATALRRFGTGALPARTSPAMGAAGGAAQEQRVAQVDANGRPTAVLFGLGNYAKTQILPHVSRHLALAAVHEVDPEQLVAGAPGGVTLDTSPLPRDDERYDAWFIAGFHHTHAPLAVRALAQGAYAVVEKPAATTRGQLAALDAALTGTAAERLFVCFHKRYSRLHEWAMNDLAVAAGHAIDMHAIVYEIPLPERHWYNWPTSGSRLVSNGCHWLDYFLFVNGFGAVAAHGVAPLRGRDVLAWVRLESGAQLTLTITDTGSERLGVRDVIELRAGRVTARFIDATDYVAENSQRVLRRGRVNPMAAYAHMYDSICRRIVQRAPADPLTSLGSTRLMLGLEDQLAALRSPSLDTFAAGADITPRPFPTHFPR